MTSIPNATTVQLPVAPVAAHSAATGSVDDLQDPVATAAVMDAINDVALPPHLPHLAQLGATKDNTPAGSVLEGQAKDESCRKIKIYVRNSLRDKTRLINDIPVTIKVRELKDRIHGQGEAGRDAQMLVSPDGAIMQNKKTLQEYKIKNGDTLQLHNKLWPT